MNSWGCGTKPFLPSIRGKHLHNESTNIIFSLSCQFNRTKTKDIHEWSLLKTFFCYSNNEWISLCCILIGIKSCIRIGRRILKLVWKLCRSRRWWQLERASINIDHSRQTLRPCHPSDAWLQLCHFGVRHYWNQWSERSYSQNRSLNSSLRRRRRKVSPTFEVGKQQ